MNPLHYPSLERSIALTKAGFPETEKFWYNNAYAWDDSTRLTIEPQRENGGKEKKAKCPSQAEMLDLIPGDIEIEGNVCFFNIHKYVIEEEWNDTIKKFCETYSVVYEDFHRKENICIFKDDILANALADIILHLLSLGYRFEEGRLIK